MLLRECRLLGRKGRRVLLGETRCRLRRLRSLRSKGLRIEHSFEITVELCTQISRRDLGTFSAISRSFVCCATVSAAFARSADRA